MSRGKILVVGGGIAGLSTAWGLARRGFAVELFEQGPLPNPRASSYDEHRIIRHAYGRWPGYARMMPAAFRTWERLWAELGDIHYEPTGIVHFLRDGNGFSDADWYTPTTDSLRDMGIGFRDIPLAEVAGRFPMVRTDRLRRVVESDGAGLLFPARILLAMTGLLARLGVVLHAETKVERIDPERGRLTANGREHAGDAVVVCAGAWAEKLVPELRASAVPSRQAVLFLAPPPRLAAAWASAPVMIDEGLGEENGGVYTLPPRRGTRLKVGDHLFSRQGDADGDRTATEADLARLWPAARAAYVGLDEYTVLERKACYYTVTETEEFIIRPIGAAGWICSACSGHGFKLGALIGDGLAAGISGQYPAAQLTDWAAGRLSADPPPPC